MKKRASFTLLELLVVIAIIAVLAAILLPAISSSKATATSASCLNNLRQLQLAWIQYADDHNSTMVPGTWDALDTGPVWDFGLAPSWVLGNAWTNQAGWGITNGLLFPYTRSSGVYHCPGDQSTLLDSPQLRQISYGLNAYENGHYMPWIRSIGPYMLTKTTDWTRPSPSATLTFIDVHEYCIGAGEFFSTPDGKSALWGMFPATRHSAGFNLSLVDGHVEHHRLKYTGQRYSTYPYGDTVPVMNRADWEDFRWITNREILPLPRTVKPPPPPPPSPAQ